jgi:hypothetical protein
MATAKPSPGNGPNGNGKDTDPIVSKYRALGGANGFLGRSVGAEQELPDGGLFQAYQGGVIYWSLASGAHEVHGAILAKWSALGRIGSLLGYPVSDETDAGDQHGRFSVFQRGVIYWTPTTDAHEVHGAILERWSAAGRQAGILGYPLTDELDAGGQAGGRFNQFERGIVFWTAQLGAHEAHGAIAQRWLELGGRTFGFPVTDETATPDGLGRFNDFTGNRSIYWTPETGAHAVEGAIRQAWLNLGGAADMLGFPTTDELIDSTGLRVQSFQGVSLAWTAEKGAHLRVLVDSTGTAIWRTPAALSFFSDMEDTGRPRFEVNVGWAPRSHPTSVVATRMAVPTPRVRFGPFFLSVHQNLLNRPPVVCTISVLARSPSMYTQRADGTWQFNGATADLVEIGRGDFQFAFEDDVPRTVHVEAILPGVFNALKLRATMKGGGWNGTTVDFPVGCGSLPLQADAPQQLDRPCLQAAVNPLGMVVPRVVPLTILYEPPGDCSWANATDTHVAGTALTVSDAQSTSTHTIHDSTLLGFSLDHTDFSEDKTSASDRKSEVRVTASASLGTRLGLPRESPRDCEPTEADRRGPGRGDLFVFLVDPPAIYWDADNLSNFLFAGAGLALPGVAPQFEAVFAWQLAANQGLPAGLSLSEQERAAMLSLDPFTDPNLEFEERGGLRWPKLPKRFVLLTPVPIGLGRDVGFESETMRDVLSAGSIKTAVRNNTTGSETDDLDLPVRLTLSALTFELGFAAGGAAGAVVEAIGRRGWSDLSQKEMTDLRDKVKDNVQGAFPALFTDTTVTTTTVTYSQSRQVDRLDDHAITQRFFLQDRDEGMTVAIYYDAFFGTFAFAQLRPT